MSQDVRVLIKSTSLPILLFMALSLSSLNVFAFYTVQDTAELLRRDEYKASAELQFVTSDDTGVNVIGRYDQGIDEESNFRFMVGTGTTNFQIGAFYKWVPNHNSPDEASVAFNFGGHYAYYDAEDNDENGNEFALRFIPLISKPYLMDSGIATPYAALPISFQNYENRSQMPVQLVLGSRYRHAGAGNDHNPDHHHDCRHDQNEYSIEFGFDLNDAINYISFGVFF